MSKNLNHFFFIINLNILRVVLLTQYLTKISQQNIGDKMLKVGKKKWYISKKRKVKKWCQLWVKVKTSYNLSLNLHYEINYCENIVKVVLKWLYSSLF